MATTGMAEKRLPKATSGRRWGDEPSDELDTKQADVPGLLPAPSETPVDHKGIKTVTEWKLNERGQRVRVTRTIRVRRKTIKINKRQQERKQWAKFGDTASGQGASESNVTYTTFEEVLLEKPSKLRGGSNLADDAKEGGSLSNAPVGLAVKGSGVVTCRLCGESGHFSWKCPNRGSAGADEQLAAANPFARNSDNSSDSAPKSSLAALAEGGAKTSKYVPPNMRSGFAGTPTSEFQGDQDASLRVTNLSEEIEDQDLYDLFRQFGTIAKIYHAKDFQTRASRGFAFVHYTRREDAERALEQMNGYGLDHLIINVEWAKPSNQGGGGGSGGGGGAGGAP